MNITRILTGDDPGTWYPIDGFGSARVKIRKLKPKETSDIRQQATRERMRGGRVEEKVNSEALNDALLDRCIIEWDGIEDDNGPIECNFENKKKLDDNWSEFSELWNNVFANGTTNVEDIEEGTVKN